VDNYQVKIVYATQTLSGITVEVYDPDQIPCWFHRLAQRFTMGIVWELKNPGLHRTRLFKIKLWIHHNVPGIYFKGYGSRGKSDGD